MCLDPDVVPPMAGFLLVAVLGVLHHILSVVFVCVFETAHGPRSFYVSRDAFQASTTLFEKKFLLVSNLASSLGRYVFGSEISYNKAPPRLPGLAY
jgi:hypothetical protein